MNWDAIGAIAELLGAVGVIASLVYLARQMGQNARATRAAAYQQLVGSLNETILDRGGGPEREQAIRMGMADFARLSEEESEENLEGCQGETMRLCLPKGLDFLA